MAQILIHLGVFVAGFAAGGLILYPTIGHLLDQACDGPGGVTLFPEGSAPIIWGAVGIIIASAAIAVGFIAGFWAGALAYVALWLAALVAAALAVRHG